jgi:hypothetical protein
MTDRTPTTTAAFGLTDRFKWLDPDEWTALNRGILAIEDEARAPLVVALEDVRTILDKHVIRLARYGYPGSKHTETFAREAVAIIDAALSHEDQP